VTRGSNRRLVLVTAALFVISTMFPIVAAAVRPEPAPLWKGSHRA